MRKLLPIRRLIFAGCIAALAVVVMFTHAEDAAVSLPAPLDPSLTTFLATPVGQFRLNGVSFEQAMQLIERTAHARFVIDWRAIEDAGYHRDTPIRLRTYGLPPHKILQLILIDAQAGNVSSELRFRIDEDGLVQISTEPVTSHALVARVYDVRDILLAYHDSLAGTWRDGPRKSMFLVAGADTLGRLVMDTVDPEHWADTGRGPGRIREWSGQLIVTTTDENHQMIERVLYNLRRAGTGRGHAEHPDVKGVDLLAAPENSCGR